MHTHIHTNGKRKRKRNISLLMWEAVEVIEILVSVSYSCFLSHCRQNLPNRQSRQWQNPTSGHLWHSGEKGIVVDTRESVQGVTVMEGAL